jgi:hypothetical protein
MADIHGDEAAVYVELLAVQIDDALCRIERSNNSRSRSLKKVVGEYFAAAKVPLLAPLLSPCAALIVDVHAAERMPVDIEEQQPASPKFAMIEVDQVLNGMNTGTAQCLSAADAPF